MLIQAVILNLGATKTLCHENINGAKTALPAQGYTMDFFRGKAELYQCLLSQRHHAFLQLFVETSFCQKLLQLESFRHYSFQNHRNSSYIWGESTDEFENSKILVHFAFQSQNQKTQKPKSFSQVQMNPQRRGVCFAAKVKLSCFFKLCRYFRIAKFTVDFSWNCCLKFFKVISISHHTNNFKLHFGFIVSVYSLPRIAKVQKVKTSGTWQEGR